MATVSNKRSVMTLYSNPNDVYSHQVRIVLAEKGVTVDVINCEDTQKPEDLLDLNPYSSLPTLVDRDLILYESRIILEYLDERFPHPPLMPVYPIARAECRRMMYRVERDWYTKLQTVINGSGEDATQARKDIEDTFTSSSPIFASKPYFLSDEFTLVDCWLAPLLWRCQSLEIQLPEQNKPLQEYMQRLFNRDSFQASLSDKERELRK